MHVTLLYVLASVFVGLLSGRRRMGFWGGLFGSLLFTPIIGAVLVLVSGKVRDDPRS